MSRRLAVAALLTVALAAAPADLGACGDKFLRVGRSPRFTGYAAVHPASILLLVPQNGKASAVKEFASELTRAGHRFQAVATIEALASALAGGRVDIVIAAVADAPRVRAHTRAAVSKPEVLPVVHKPTGTERAAIEREYRRVLKLPAARHEALAAIDSLMDDRLKAAQANGAN